MAVRKQCESQTYVAGADLSSHQYGFVYQSDANTVSKAADAQNGSEARVFVLQNAPEAGELAECAVPGAQTLLKVVDSSAAIASDLMISTGGFGTARVGAGKYTRAKVDEAVTAANQIVVVDFNQPQLVTT